MEEVKGINCTKFGKKERTLEEDEDLSNFYYKMSVFKILLTLQGHSLFLFRKSER